MTRDGAWAERVAVDHRIVARIPEGLTFADAASLPIGAITAWEAIFRDQNALPIRGRTRADRRRRGRGRFARDATLKSEDKRLRH